ncbi:MULTISPECIES: hypothetical protein [unclassified Imperialibacter]|uniref:hypothetical protein n=1 Tax=unclassified Imperialibacter TaxID=2629706 RepID=UPI0012566491|nr:MULTISPECIES: hypothetical protein [unclassified Imperialibacter]CAD5253789.1 hypothetical protein IMPERIA75_200019 [Imperialibacter sp. 75]CAD5262142.1 hypothetical protein IMPERIA89_290019 [Imperialibacter sp. 89]VVT35195.1 hypothetical protein IMPR6_80019 [Imperialibacter sp. EC-SDR9]
MKPTNLTGKLNAVVDEIRKRLSLTTRPTEEHPLKGIHEYRIEIRLKVKGGERLTKRFAKQAVLNDMWTIPTKGIVFAIREPVDGLVEMDISYYAIAANTDHLLSKLRAIENVKDADVAQTQAT